MSKREEMLAELRIWEQQVFTKELYEYISTRISELNLMINECVRKQEHHNAAILLGERDAMIMIRQFGEEWVEENAD